MTVSLMNAHAGDVVQSVRWFNTVTWQQHMIYGRLITEEGGFSLVMWKH